MFSAALYARVQFCLCYRTRDRGCSAHPAFPAPSVFEGETKAIARAFRAARTQNYIRVIVCNKRGAFVHESGAKQSIAPQKERMDCFVASAPLRKRFAFVAGNDEKP
jgi:hypothetical protein